MGKKKPATSDELKEAKKAAAALLGRLGGEETAKRGSDYFRKLSLKRKHFGGGRPKKS